MDKELASLFPGVPAAHLAAARDRFYTVEVGRGVTLMEEGEQDAAVLFILEGRVAITTGDYEIASVGGGGLVGEIGMFGSALRIATVRAVQPTVLLVLDRADYDALVDAGNHVAYAIETLALQTISSRLRDADARIAAVAQGGAAATSAAETDGLPVRPGDVDVLGALQQSVFFAGAPIGALDDVAGRMTPVRFSAGEALCRQGSRGNDMYLLARGEVEVTVEADGKVEGVARLEPGDVFGMASVLQDRPRMASCVARGDVVALRMDAASCKRLVAADERAGSVLRTAMIRALADQIAYANAQFAQLSLVRKRKTAELLARLGIEAHGRHVK